MIEAAGIFGTYFISYYSATNEGIDPKIYFLMMNMDLSNLEDGTNTIVGDIYYKIYNGKCFFVKFVNDDIQSLSTVLDLLKLTIVYNDLSKSTYKIIGDIKEIIITYNAPKDEIIHIVECPENKEFKSVKYTNKHINNVRNVLIILILLFTIIASIILMGVSLSRTN